MPAPASPLLTRKEAQAYLKCGKTYVVEHADEIGCVRRGGRLYFYQRDLDRWNERHYSPPPRARETTQRSATAPTAGVIRLDPDRINPVTKRPYGVAQ